MSIGVHLRKTLSSPLDSEEGSPTTRPSNSVEEEDAADQEKQPPIERGHKKRIKILSTSTTPSTYWRNTFALTMSPLILSGFPSYILLKESSSEINSVCQWALHLFDFRSRRLLPRTLVTCFLLLLTLCLHLVLLRQVVVLHESLFVSGHVGSVVANKVGQVVIYLTQVSALNYFWLHGFKIKRLIELLDKKHGRHGQVRCGYRTPLLLLMATLMAHIAVKYSRPGFVSKVDEEERDFIHGLKVIFPFTNYVFFAFTFPVYCTFCFGIRFELLLIKDYLYDQISKRITPNVRHLNKIKIWFTHAADHIVYVNSLFWVLLAAVIAIWLWDIFDDAETLTKLARTQFAIFVEYVLHTSAGNGEESFKTNKTLTLSEEKAKLLDPEYAVKVYKDIVWVTITCSIMVYTVWQAVLTNDAVKHVQNWLNDFAIGGGGSDVAGILNELRRVNPARDSKKVKIQEMTGNEDDTGFKEVKVVRNGSVTDLGNKNEGKDNDDDDVKELEYESESEVPLLWTAQNVANDGEDYDDMFFKANTLRTYITVRIKLENPALLSVMVFGNIIPYLSNRMEGYKL